MEHSVHFLSYLTQLLLRTRNVSNKSCTENQNTRFMFNVFFENRAVYEIMWKNVKPDRPQMTMRRLRIACSIIKATNRHSEYAILIALLQQWLHERASMLSCYVRCLSCSLPSPHDVTSIQNAILCAFTRQSLSLWMSQVEHGWAAYH